MKNTSILIRMMISLLMVFSLNLQAIANDNNPEIEEIASAVTAALLESYEQAVAEREWQEEEYLETEYIIAACGQARLTGRQCMRVIKRGGNVSGITSSQSRKAMRYLYPPSSGSTRECNAGRCVNYNR